MHSTILIPIDMAHVEKVEAMIDVANTQAANDAKIILLHVIDAIPKWAKSFMPEGIQLEPQQVARDKLQAIAKANSIAADILVRTGHSYNTILEVAEESGAELIVVASHHPGYGDYFLGSTAAKVVRHARCSVFVIR